MALKTTSRESLRRTTVIRRGRSMSGMWMSPVTVRMLSSICLSFPWDRTFQCLNGLVMIGLLCEIDASVRSLAWDQAAAPAFDA